MLGEKLVQNVCWGASYLLGHAPCCSLHSRRLHAAVTCCCQLMWRAALSNDCSILTGKGCLTAAAAGSSVSSYVSHCTQTQKCQLMPFQVHHVTRQIEYHGELMSLTEAIIGFPVGGQVLISGSTYQRIYGRLHTIGPLTPIAPPQGRSALGRAKSHSPSSQPKEAWTGESAVTLL